MDLEQAFKLLLIAGKAYVTNREGKRSAVDNLTTKDLDLIRKAIKVLEDRYEEIKEDDGTS